MIPSRELDPDLVEALKQIKAGVTYQDVMSAFMLVVLERNFGNKTRTSRELKMPVRTLRSRLHNVASLGYTVCPYDAQKQLR
jgi:DNA-binding NtrC family response regulator